MDKSFKLSAYHIIFVILVLIFIRHGVLNHEFSCEHTIPNISYRQFVHVELFHLLVNLYGLYILSRVEEKIGFKNFSILILSLLVVSTLIEFGVSKFTDLNCSIGFSGILFGILAWELVTGQEINFSLVAILFFMVLQPSLTNPKASLVGHAIGACSGIIVGLITKQMLV